MKTISILVILLAGFLNLKYERPSTAPPDCLCYAKGKSYKVSDMECLGGHWAACEANPNNEKYCGWVYQKDPNGYYVKCDD